MLDTVNIQHKKYSTIKFNNKKIQKLQKWNKKSVCFFVCDTDLSGAQQP